MRNELLRALNSGRNNSIAHIYQHSVAWCLRPKPFPLKSVVASRGPNRKGFARAMPAAGRPAAKPKGKAQALLKPRASPRAKAKGKAKAKARSRVSRLRRQQRGAANARQRLRKDAVTALNQLATELQLLRAHVPLKGVLATEPKVERLIRALEPRCQADDLLQRLRGATQLWRHNGGALSQPMTEAPVLPEEGDAQGVADFDDTPLLPRHKVLEPGYILQSTAFMLTFNSHTLKADSWGCFRHWVKQERKDLGARAWAACIELSSHARPTESWLRHHLHCNFVRTNGVGILRGISTTSSSTTSSRVWTSASRTKGFPQGPPPAMASGMCP